MVDRITLRALGKQMKWVGPFLVLAVAGGASAGFGLALERARRSWSTLELAARENVLRVQTADIAPIDVLRPEVIRIVDALGRRPRRAHERPAQIDPRPVSRPAQSR